MIARCRPRFGARRSPHHWPGRLDFRCDKQSTTAVGVFLFRSWAAENEPQQVLGTLTLRALLSLNRPVRAPMISIIPIEVVWLASGFIMLMAAFLASAAE
jgi:hypothetical protein